MSVNGIKNVSFDYYVLLFFLVSFLGWLWEVGIYLVREGRFVNRGILFGPWLPVYGSGALFLYLLLRRWKRRPMFVFLISLTVCSLLEYLAGFFLEKAWGVRWWDYSGMLLNLNGHVCLMSSLMFGLPTSPECTFTATFPESSIPRASYSFKTASGVISFVKKTFDFPMINLPFHFPHTGHIFSSLYYTGQIPVQVKHLFQKKGYFLQVISAPSAFHTR